MNRYGRWAPAILLGSLLACSQATAPTAGPQESVPAAAPAASATVQAVADSSSPVTTAAPVYDARVIHFGGYGPAAFLGNEESVRQAFGRPMTGSADPKDPAACYYLRAEAPQARGYGIRFMFESGKFVRYDVEDSSIVAPGGLVVGMKADAVAAAFAGQVESQPHKYVEGAKVLVVTPPEGGQTRLIFETDANGVITTWRMGVQPQVHYVEGCS